MLRPRRTSFPESPRAIYPQIWAQTRVHAAQKQCCRVRPLRSSAYLAAPKTSREKRPIFGHVADGAGKSVHFGSPHRSLEFTSRRFSQLPYALTAELRSQIYSPRRQPGKLSRKHQSEAYRHGSAAEKTGTRSAAQVLASSVANKKYSQKKVPVKTVCEND